MPTSQRRNVPYQEKEYICDHPGCGLAYNIKNNLLRHKNLKHGRQNIKRTTRTTNEYVFKGMLNQNSGVIVGRQTDIHASENCNYNLEQGKDSEVDIINKDKTSQSGSYGEGTEEPIYPAESDCQVVEKFRTEDENTKEIRPQIANVLSFDDTFNRQDVEQSERQSISGTKDENLIETKPHIDNVLSFDHTFNNDH